MRWRDIALAVVTLTGGGGCDQIFGLSKTLPQDGPLDGMPQLKTGQPVQLTFLAFDSYKQDVGMLDALTTPAMPGLVVKVGTINDTTLTTLDEVSMDEQGNALPPGSYLVPGNIFGMVISDDDTVQPPWRLELTNVPGASDAPVELQWKPHPGMGHWAMPLLGRTDATMPSMFAGFKITPMGTGVPAMQSGSHVMTTGVFTDGQIGFDNMSTADWSFASGTVMSGPGDQAPNPDQDFGFLTTYGPGTGSFTQCRVSTGNVAFEAPDLSTDTHNEVSHDPPWAAWNSVMHNGTFNADTETAITRVDNALQGGTAAVHVYYGYTPTIELPFFLAHGEASSRGLLDPSMFTLSDCPVTIVGQNAPLPPWSEPDRMAQMMKEVLRMTVTETRTVTTIGYTVDSGLEAVVTNNGTPRTFAMDFPVSMVETAKLTTSIGLTDLSVAGSGTDGMHVPMGTGLVQLDITPEVGSGPSGTFAVDYYQVALRTYDTGAGKLKTVRTFITSEPKVQIDAGSFTPGTEYQFEVRAYRGTPNAKLGDFVTQQYPQAVASAYTHSFVAE
ncbi:MAG TPA: hypothetical protein VGM88_19655 [Kofleriaceae bacterium]|jgi:hypothetical protein